MGWAAEGPKSHCANSISKSITLLSKHPNTLQASSFKNIRAFKRRTSLSTLSFFQPKRNIKHEKKRKTRSYEEPRHFFPSVSLRLGAELVGTPRGFEFHGLLPAHRASLGHGQTRGAAGETEKEISSDGLVYVFYSFRFFSLFSQKKQSTRILNDSYCPLWAHQL